MLFQKKLRQVGGEMVKRINANLVKGILEQWLMANVGNVWDGAILLGIAQPFQILTRIPKEKEKDPKEPHNKRDLRDLAKLATMCCKALAKPDSKEVVKGTRPRDIRVRDFRANVGSVARLAILKGIALMRPPLSKRFPRYPVVECG